MVDLGGQKTHSAEIQYIFFSIGYWNKILEWVSHINVHKIHPMVLYNYDMHILPLVLRKANL